MRHDDRNTLRPNEKPIRADSRPADHRETTRLTHSLQTWDGPGGSKVMILKTSFPD